MAQEKDFSNAPRNWVTTLLFSITFLIAITAVPAYGIIAGYDWFEVSMFFTLLIFSGISVTAGYHRLWAHKTYDANPLVKLFFAFWGAAAVQNSILIWSSGHRRHHRHIDDDDNDPYSINRGFWFAHIGWMLKDYPSGELDFANARDLQRDPIVMNQHKYYLIWVMASAVAVPLLLGYLNGDILGMALLAGVLRLVVNHHVTFFINSLCHMWGRQPYTDTNTAKDNDLLAFFTYGEGYHNFHHYFQNDYRNGVLWWQFDPTKWLIAVLSWLKLASNLRRVPSFKIQEALVKMQFERANKQLTSTGSKNNVEAWRETLEKEYQQFLNTLSDWKELRTEWYENKREAINTRLTELNEKKLELQSKWHNAAISTRFKEMEYVLKMQQKRLQLFNLNFQTVMAN
ncbi:MAG: fatty acid desaturase [Ketobacteraceae bacterium]|nr:fatty acid desaturase [Ketobacteraceae bacterium]